MKKTINVNLGGQPFIIDEQAYETLHSYLEALKLKFTNEAERKEILSDIEARVAEIFTQKLAKSRAVVSEEDVAYVISLMGRPEDIAGETEATTGPEAKSTGPSSPIYSGPVEKKFFRDPDNKKVGGVISGLAHYFGWGDPTWIRIVTLVILVLSMTAGLGLGFPIAVVYLILLIVVPEASTSAEKLQMRGQPVTIHNIEKEVRDAMTTAGNSINTMVRDNNTGAKIIAVTLLIGRAFAKVFSVALLLACIFILFCLLSVFLGLSFLTEVSLSDMAHMLISGNSLIYLAYASVFLAIAMPLVSIMYEVIRFLANSKAHNPAFRWIIRALWIASVVLLFVVGTFVAKDFNSADTVKEKIVLTSPPGGSLMIRLSDSSSHQFFRKGGRDEDFAEEFFHNDLFIKTANGFALGDMRLEIAVSPDSNFYLEKIAFSRGTTFADAGKNLQQIHYKFSQSDSTISLDNKYELPLHAKWRAQKIKIRIYVPEGKQLIFADNIDRIAVNVRDNDNIDESILPGKILRVENGKIKCLNCKEEIMNDSEEEKPGTPETSDASKHDNLKNVSVSINQHGVSVSGKNEKDEQVRVKVNEKGIRVITTDSNGVTTVKKEQ